ncbi:hypothetical protein [Cereibacter sphaeroides]|uniref:hypothetical protein n=1 Tax=Cereibacter sphaeroides TaxID=1063 RepID=UPI003FCDAE5F
MARFYFPLLFWIPSSSVEVDAAPFGLHPRRWDVSVFDLYSLAAEKHPIRMTAELMQFYLRHVNLEISVDAADHAEAKKHLDTLRAMLYIDGIMPTIAPFATSYSINEYAGMNSRSSSRLRGMLPEDMRIGITAQDSRVEGWPAELTFSVLHGEDDSFSMAIHASAFMKATEAVAEWQEIEAQSKKAAILRTALAKAPLFPDRESSILFIWQALEAVFGKGPELSFRMSISLAELCGPVAPRTETYAEAKKSYKDRSEITHGKAHNVDDKTWMRAWGLLARTIRSILRRRCIPSEDELFSELLSRGSP